jgi:uncharacterized membrane protein
MDCLDSGIQEQEAPDERIEERASKRYLGSVVYGHEVRSFRACGSEETFWVTDRTGLLWDLHQELALKTQPYEEVFFVLSGYSGPAPVEGFGADYAGELVVEEIVYAAREGFSCDSNWKGFSYCTLGNEPFWSAEVSDQGLFLKRLGESDLQWTDLTREQSASRTIFISQEIPAAPLMLEVVSAPCRDSMSGAFFGYTARLQLGSEEFQGCALKMVSGPE